MGCCSLKTKYKRKLLLAGVAVFVLSSVQPAIAQQDNIPAMPENMQSSESQPENIMGDAPPADTSAPDVTTSGPVAPPSQEVLDDLDRQLENIQKMINESNDGQGSENSLPVIDAENEPDVFYDSVPVRRGVQPTAPEKVDPNTKPAGKIIYVTKDFEAGDDQSILVSARRALDLGRYDSALDLYDQLYKKNRRDARVLMGRAIALQNLGQVQTAIQTYEELLDVDPKNIEAEITMLGLVKDRFPALALKRLLELYDSNPNSAALNAQIGLSYAGVGNEKDGMRYLGTAVSLDPNNASYVYNLAVLSDRAGKLKDALKFYEEALSKDSIYGASRSVPRDAIYERLSVIRTRI